MRFFDGREYDRLVNHQVIGQFYGAKGSYRFLKKIMILMLYTNYGIISSHRNTRVKEYRVQGIQGISRHGLLTLPQ